MRGSVSEVCNCEEARLDDLSSRDLEQTLLTNHTVAVQIWVCDLNAMTTHLDNIKTMKNLKCTRLLENVPMCGKMLLE